MKIKGRTERMYGSIDGFEAIKVKLTNNKEIYKSSLSLDIYALGGRYFKSKSSAKRAALRWAKRLGLEVEWVDG
jgi:hypothetical protein